MAQRLLVWLRDMHPRDPDPSKEEPDMVIEGEQVACPSDGLVEIRHQVWPFRATYFNAAGPNVMAVRIETGGKDG